MGKFKLMFAVLVIAGMASCNNATTEGTEGTTPAADTTHTHTDGESHEGHDH